MNPSGHNPMRWDCERQGCFNKKRRPKIEQFADLWPGRISMGDVDGIVEINGHVLMLEWKTNRKDLPLGQSIMYERLSMAPDCLVCVFCVDGDAEHMIVSRVKVFFNRQEQEWQSATMETLRSRMRGWALWAMKQPKLKPKGYVEW